MFQILTFAVSVFILPLWKTSFWIGVLFQTLHCHFPIFSTFPFTFSTHLSLACAGRYIDVVQVCSTLDANICEQCQYQPFVSLCYRGMKHVTLSFLYCCIICQMCFNSLEMDESMGMSFDSQYVRLRISSQSGDLRCHTDFVEHGSVRRCAVAVCGVWFALCQWNKLLCWSACYGDTLTECGGSVSSLPTVVSATCCIATGVYTSVKRCKPGVCE